MVLPGSATLLLNQAAAYRRNAGPCGSKRKAARAASMSRSGSARRRHLRKHLCSRPTCSAATRMPARRSGKISNAKFAPTITWATGRSTLRCGTSRGDAVRYRWRAFSAVFALACRLTRAPTTAKKKQAASIHPKLSLTTPHPAAHKALLASRFMAGTMGTCAVKSRRYRPCAALSAMASR
jgi:hypothetical protein